LEVVSEDLVSEDLVEEAAEAAGEAEVVELAVTS